MKNHHVLYKKGDCRWTVLHRDPEKYDELLDSNEYLITVGNKHMLLDPGGFAIFPSVLSTLVQMINPQDIELIFASHQDPDIASSLSLWKEIKPEIKCHVSWLWENFVPHFGGDAETYVPIPDKGHKIDLNGHIFETVPAHHMHSAGNFHLYDREAKILFSGDTGAAFLPNDQRYLFVDDFEAHTPYIDYFHRRWFGSNEHKNDWCERVSEMDIELLCPQHGAIYFGDNVKRFIDWLYKLNVGSANNRGNKL
ncbi:MAG: flavoprotein [SAR324 cluster bacterium]|uniref:Flavoprotein n=1 Tax=SAR324 cluster bacterium TaxID=2024889 RepID=A0A2A4TA74_9DELT|nr:MAG: flavoprotein [SAR324 cluster bacterium]